MTDRQDADRMLSLAKVDLKAIRNMLDPDLFEDSVFGFHAQQAVEKAPKAWLSLRGMAYPKTHDLRLLVGLLGTQDVGSRVRIRESTSGERRLAPYFGIPNHPELRNSMTDNDTALTTAAFSLLCSPVL